MQLHLLSVVAVFLVLGCGKGGSAPASSSSASKPVGDYKAQMAAALTEEKLAGFAVYQHEMIPQMGLTMSVALGALKDGKSFSDAEKAAANDERTKALKAAQEAACKKAGLQGSDIPGLTLITSEYYSRRGTAVTLQNDLDTARKKIADAKAAGKEPNSIDTTMEKTYLEMLGREPDIKKDYVAKYGQAVVDLLSKHETEFLEINKLMLDAALQKPAAK
jgi:hypothetical protein